MKTWSVIFVLAASAGLCCASLGLAVSECYKCKKNCNGTLEKETCKGSKEHFCATMRTEEESRHGKAVFKHCVDGSSVDDAADNCLKLYDVGECKVCNINLCNSAKTQSVGQVGLILLSSLIVILVNAFC